MKKIYTLAIALMSGVILTACVGAVNIGGGISSTCQSNPFDATCGAGSASARAIVINKCMVGDRAQSDIACGQAVAGTNNCLIDPFIDACEQNAFFKDHFLNARDSRSEFCSDLDNGGKSFCLGKTINNICKHNPFGERCERGFEDDREKIAKDCNDSTNTEENSCPLAIGNCISNPFSTDCETTLRFYYNTAREAVCKDEPTSNRCKDLVSVCDTNPFDKDCGDEGRDARETAIKNCEESIKRRDTTSDCQNMLPITTECLLDPSASICSVNTSDITFELDNAPNAPNTDGVVILKHDFLNLTDNKISTAGFTDFTTPATICTQDRCALQSASAVVGDGYAYYIANDANGNAKYSYAGILNTTNLGLPLYSFTSPTATWRGEWSLNGDAPNTSSEADDLVLEINYREQKLNGRGEKMIGGVVHEIMVSGNYNESGAILAGEADLVRGRITYQGFLIGLIGQKGAVGAFRSSDSDVSFAGGFVVRPPSE